ncbi:MAG TPA: hypothetical protein PLB95_02175 [Syntrophales bacterium]|nr:hypothetical protein [Syntrophales bacterium]HPL67762.1 hypothetical protein [Smithellaceae bacterium]HPX80672.1 hypothetical protein [Syntrophales bacterium]
MKFKTLMMGVCAALAVVSVEPMTGLLEVSVALVGAAVGAVIADPIAEEAAEVKKQIQAVKEAVAQRRAAAAPVVA